MLPPAKNFYFLQIRSQRRARVVPVASRDFRRRHLDPVPHLLAVRPADAEVHGKPPQIGSLHVADALRGAG